MYILSCPLHFDQNCRVGFAGVLTGATLKVQLSEMSRQQLCKSFGLFGQCAMGGACQNMHIGSLHKTTSNDDTLFGATAAGGLLALGGYQRLVAERWSQQQQEQAPAVAPPLAAPPWVAAAAAVVGGGGAATVCFSSPSPLLKLGEGAGGAGSLEEDRLDCEAEVDGGKDQEEGRGDWAAEGGDRRQGTRSAAAAAATAAPGRGPPPRPRPPPLLRPLSPKKKDPRPPCPPPAWPPPFEEDGAAWAFRAASGWFFEAASGWYYEPRSKLYYGVPPGAAPGADREWHLHRPGGAPPFRRETESVTPDGCDNIQTLCLKRKRSGEVIRTIEYRKSVKDLDLSGDIEDFGSKKKKELKEYQQNVKDLDLSEDTKDFGSKRGKDLKERRQRVRDLDLLEDTKDFDSKREKELKDAKCSLRKTENQCLKVGDLDQNTLRGSTASRNSTADGDPCIKSLLTENKQLVQQNHVLKVCLQIYKEIANDQVAHAKKFVQLQADNKIQQSKTITSEGFIKSTGHECKISGKGRSDFEGQSLPPAAVAEGGEEGEMVQVTDLAVTAFRGTGTAVKPHSATAQAGSSERGMEAEARCSARAVEEKPAGTTCRGHDSAAAALENAVAVAREEEAARIIRRDLADMATQAEEIKCGMEAERRRANAAEEKLVKATLDRQQLEDKLKNLTATARKEVQRVVQQIECEMEAERRRANAAEEKLTKVTLERQQLEEQLKLTEETATKEVQQMVAKMILDRQQLEEKLGTFTETARKEVQCLKRDLKEAEVKAEKDQRKYEDEKARQRKAEKELERLRKDVKHYKARMREKSKKLEAERDYSALVKKDLRALEKRLKAVNVKKEIDGSAVTKNSNGTVLQDLQLQLDNAVEHAKSTEAELAKTKDLLEDSESKVARADELLADVHEANEAEQDDARKQLARAQERACAAEALAEAAEARAGAAEEAAARARAECGRLAGRADLAEAQAEAAAGAAEAQAKRASAQVALAQGKVMALESKLAAMVNEAERREVALAAAMAATAAREKELAAERTQAAARVEELAAARAEMAASGKELATARAEVADRGEELAAASAKRVAKKKELATARAEAAARGKELVAARAETAARGKELAAARAQVAAGMKELLHLRAEVKSSRRQPEPGPAAVGRVPLDGRLKLRRLFEDNKWYHGKVLGYNHTHPKESRYLVEFEDGDLYQYGEEEIIRLAVEGLLPISQQLSDANDDKNFGQST